jgi:colicin import membrane protein
MNAMTDTAPYSIPPEPGRWRAITLAALMHLFLLLFFWIGIRWTNETPATIDADGWRPPPRAAAPAPVPIPAPEPEKTPEPKPVVKEPPKPVVEEKPVVKPDIALEQEKKRKAEEKKRLEEEQQAKLKKQKEKEEAEKLAKAKAAEEERLKKEKLEKDKKLADAKRKQQEADEKLLAKIREEDMKRLAGGVTGTGGTGDAAKSQGGRADAGYAARVAAKIKSNITFNVPEGLADNSPVEFTVDLLPDGSVAGIRKTRSSGVPGFDEAVRRAIEKSQPFPKDKNGSVPSSFVGVHRPKDQ